ncbi:hypothetical protein FIBSPDRAFT_940206 [Athelia psychrophila]|uniref:Uncharacterized protein n=1 Tax=Athelia psychrophila TaxID=1759441 RepID=A0A167WDT1_9AGAM|nr:hypothetical protein FIBSPDRAFT_940206 [Fibularhizoctonia sp. CBS 109695]
MRFSTAIFVTAALSAFTSATPIDARDASVQGAQAFLTTLKTTVTPLAAELASIQSNNATTEVVQPIVDKITAALSTATKSADALKGQPQSVVLSGASANELVPLQTVTVLVEDVLTLLIPTLGKLTTILGPGGDLTPVLPPIGADLSALVGSLLVGVTGLVVGLKPTVAGILAGVSSLVTSLGLGPLVVALGL